MQDPNRRWNHWLSQRMFEDTDLTRREILFESRFTKMGVLLILPPTFLSIFFVLFRAPSEEKKIDSFLKNYSGQLPMEDLESMKKRRHYEMLKENSDAMKTAETMLTRDFESPEMQRRFLETLQQDEEST